MLQLVVALAALLAQQLAMRSAGAMVQLSVEPWVEQLGPPLTQTRNRNTPVRTGKRTIKIATPGMNILAHASAHLARLKRDVAEGPAARTSQSPETSEGLLITPYATFKNSA
jgi:hypothetical protein